MYHATSSTKLYSALAAEVTFSIAAAVVTLKYVHTQSFIFSPSERGRELNSEVDYDLNLATYFQQTDMEERTE